MYQKINDIIYQKKISKKDIAKKLGVTYNTLILKLNGKYKFTFDEALILKEILDVTTSIEELFEKADKTA